MIKQKVFKDYHKGKELVATRLFNSTWDSFENMYNMIDEGFCTIIRGALIDD